MQIRSLRTTNKPKLMIIPMIDIIFFLLVFFMMSMLSMVVQKSMPVNLPVATASSVDLQRKIPITITADGQIYVEQDSYANLEGMAQRLEAEKAKGGDLTIILRADQKAQYGTFVQVLDTLKNMNLNKIAVATESK
ncbi:ExbD/TolR family protein [Veillonella criceti]|uniref:Biopolymer transport protein exbD n=1 Tax=Veillonella criceti TaxID=103891 RepID=A0A380NKX9_9FIRM|nr:biopolymer transporter ExbD [Veillonella criceti]SUP43621.1 Biopolymer transport protein exbD [Veillonella criceti]